MSRERKSTHNPDLEIAQKVQSIYESMGRQLSHLSYGSEREVELFSADFSMAHASSRGKTSIDLGKGMLIDTDIFLNGFFKMLEEKGKRILMPQKELQGLIPGNSNAAQFHDGIRVPITVSKEEFRPAKGFSSIITRETYLEPNDRRNPLALRIFAQIDTSRWDSTS